LNDLVKPGNSKKIWQNIGVLAVFGLAVYLLLPQIATLTNSWQILLHMFLWAVGLAFVAQVISYLGSGFLLQKTLAISHQVVSILRSTLMALGSASIALVAGGSVGSSAAIFRWTSGDKGSVGGATLASLLPSLFNTLMLVLFSIFGLVHLILVNNLSHWQIIGFSITLAFLGLVIGASLLASRFRVRASKVIIWTSRQFSRVTHKTFDLLTTQKEVADVFIDWDELWKGEWLLLTLGTLINVIFDMLTLYLLFIASGINISFGVLLSGYALPLLLGKIAFILPGGVGVVETSMAALYSGLGIPNATTVVVVLGYRLISFWIPSLIGFPIAAYLQRSHRKSRKKMNTLNPTE
jgi:uncharacterized protein (TIRG00374 family)